MLATAGAVISGEVPNPDNPEPDKIRTYLTKKMTCNKPNLRYDDAASSGSAARSRYTMTQARDVTAAKDQLKLAQHSACIESNSVCLCTV